MKRILLVNPNTNAATTASMLAIAREAAAGLLQIEAMTAPEGVPMITDALALQQASQVLTGLIPELRAQNWDGVITAAYGDPALQALREGLDCPVTGIGEASMLEAAFALPQADSAISLPQSVAMVSVNPARLVGLADRGEIAVGKRADLLRISAADAHPMVCAVWRDGERAF